MEKEVDVIDAIYRRYCAVLMFCGLIGRNGEGNWFHCSPDGCNGTRFMPRETWKLAWEFWQDWPGSKVYGRSWW